MGDRDNSSALGEQHEKVLPPLSFRLAYRQDREFVERMLGRMKSHTDRLEGYVLVV
jgi:hypothetical protein